ncbi:M56 family metallopeptidase [Massilia sp. CFBP9026]|uniref:M56 family metallopeptidase n=1 Tax=Massilia sp. CFBP9026 TaxID=3096536 RepID=UPI002A6AFD69|nr:M56 family metallopeptidase [Massilia sp. CFBP9026]MDY0960894.1 M56 family metallopeptidase [Massilia sp. CFBP9026]
MNAFGIVDSIGWTLIHFSWQGALVGGQTALALALLRKARPETRYLVACIGLLLCLAWPATELFLRLGNDSGADGALAIVLSGAAVGVAQESGWSGLFQRNLAWIVAAWAVCALLLALRMIAGLMWVRRAATREGHDPAWQARLDRLATQFGLARPIRLRIVNGLSSPVTAGWWRPVVLVPASLVTTMPPHLLEALLAHELAHIRRHDYLVNLCQNVIESLLFYHPAVWWISRRIRVEREQIADSIAARQLGEPRRLALALSELEKLQFSTHHLAQAANGGDLMSRIKQLVRPDTEALNWKAAIPVLGFLLAGLAGCAQTPPSSPAMARTDSIVNIPLAKFDSCERPKYPAEALARDIQGTVTLGFLVSAEGAVRETALRKSSGDTSLDEAARTALASCTFKPGTVDGKPTEQWTEVQYVWVSK